MPAIKELFAFVIQDGDQPDDEGVIGEFINNAWMPFMGADVSRVQSLMPLAQGVADHLRKPIRILKFSQLEQIGEIQPRGGVR